MERKNCPLCRARTLVGVEDTNAAALPYRLEPDPVDAIGELAAAIGGRLTWTMHSSGAVHLRSTRTIRRWPAASIPRQQVHADHACTKGET
jgi:hypothetical protein